jgi:hypothetical protein
MSAYIVHAFEFAPIALAFVAAVLCGRKYSQTRRQQERLVCALGVVCAVLLMFAQSSWWATYRMQGLGIGTDIANHVWTVFNVLTMSAFIALGWPRK